MDARYWTYEILDSMSIGVTQFWEIKSFVVILVDIQLHSTVDIIVFDVHCIDLGPTH
jgi:hypothetical protein